MATQTVADLAALSDLCTPWCVHVVVTLRIAEQLDGGITEIEKLAAAAGCDAGALHRVLGHLVTKGVFLEPAPGRFALNDAARGLLDPALRIGLDLDGIGGRFAHAWGTLLDYVRSGEPAYQQRFGLPFWQDLDTHPQFGAEFDALIGPTGHGAPDPQFEISGGWEGVRSIVDVGGGTGAMLAEILRLRPGLLGTLVDLPRTVAGSHEILPAAGVAERVTVVGQSFFEPLPAGADLYLLRGILNDWPDREAEAILRRCAEAARPGGRVVILKGVQEDDAPVRLTIESVLVGGKQRSVSEMRALACNAGLDVVAVGRQPSGYFVVECRPA
jgi:SAM-dependent methyltransferase